MKKKSKFFMNKRMDIKLYQTGDIAWFSTKN
jgi:hypothetical protein